MQWIKIFASEERAANTLTENKPQLVVANGKRICLVKHEGKYLAVSDRCTHNGESLSKGKVNHLGEIICPWHGHQFNLKSGREIHERSADLECFPIKVEQSGFYLGL
ncbi:MAG: Rieske 2Fe-2S domain-containing protein [Cyclobacteriaceae bacterium]|nr:Rieske 2Fe-2S domain-containing protein [Cyclobacteriaceae bacterium]